MSDISLNRVRAVTIGIAPVLLLIGFIILPYVSDFTDEAKVAEAVTDDARRLAWGVIILSVAVGLMLAAVVAIHMHLAAAGEQRWSPLAVFLLLVGGSMFLVASADMGLVYAEGSGTDVAAYAASGNDWAAFRIVGAVVFGLGWLSLAAAIYRSHDLSRELTWASVIGLVVLTAMLFVPMGWATYVAGVAAIVGLWPFAYHLWAPAGQPMMMGRGAAPA